MINAIENTLLFIGLERDDADIMALILALSLSLTAAAITTFAALFCLIF